MRILYTILFIISFSTVKSQFSTREIATFSKIFRKDMPTTFRPGIQIEYGILKEKIEGAKGRIYLGGDINILSLSKTSYYKAYMQSSYLGFAYYLKGGNESTFSNYVLGQIDAFGVAANLSVHNPNDSIHGIRFKVRGLSVGSGCSGGTKVAQVTHKR